MHSSLPLLFILNVFRRFGLLHVVKVIVKAFQQVLYVKSIHKQVNILQVNYTVSYINYYKSITIVMNTN